MAHAIEVEALGKYYPIGGAGEGYLTLRESLNALRRRRARRNRDGIWALRDVNLTVDEGEVVGVIGRNGAGKTTLLKLLTRITEPTTGETRTRGRVGALLEVGTGFHPELTGRENVYLNGAILGMRQRELRRKFEEIVAFANVERFIDTPVKRYSSGMRMRLAFAVAAHIEPAILIVDEVLAVGDAEFQEKCVGRMSRFGYEGRTVIFVSHDLGAIAQLCNRSVLLDNGTVVADGPTEAVVRMYFRPERRGVSRVALPPNADGPVEVESVDIADESGNPISEISAGTPFILWARFRASEQIRGLDVALYLVNERGVKVLDEASSETGRPSIDGRGRYEASLAVPPLLAPGDYTMGVWIGTTSGLGDETFVYEDVLRFRLWPRTDDRHGWTERSRIVRPAAGLKVVPAEPGEC